MYNYKLKVWFFIKTLHLNLILVHGFVSVLPSNVRFRYNANLNFASGGRYASGLDHPYYRHTKPGYVISWSFIRSDSNTNCNLGRKDLSLSSLTYLKNNFFKAFFRKIDSNSYRVVYQEAVPLGSHSVVSYMNVQQPMKFQVGDFLGITPSSKTDNQCLAHIVHNYQNYHVTNYFFDFDSYAVGQEGPRIGQEVRRFYPIFGYIIENLVPIGNEFTRKIAPGIVLIENYLQV